MSSETKGKMEKEVFRNHLDKQSQISGDQCFNFYEIKKKLNGGI